MNTTSKGRIDWLLTLTPFILIMALAVLLFIFPDGSNNIISKVRFFFGDTMGIYYLIIGAGVLIVSLFLALSKYGNIVLGEPGEKPKYSFFTWGCMMFTCGLAADILFYSFSEWVMYADNPHIAELGGSVEEWAGVFPLFHWSFIPWAFYLVLAVAFGFMLHVRKRNRQRYSEACRPVIGKHADGLLGRIIDLFALFALLAGTATTFSVATPLMAGIIVKLFGISLSRTVVTIIILLITCAVYTYAVLHGFKGISFLAKLCIYLFFGLLIIVLLIGGQGRFIIENGFQSLGKMFQNFVGLSTYADPMRTNNFPQDWTIYYWAYWMVWCIAAPFFIGNISKGRTIRQTVLGGYIFGVGSTIVSFIILGNYSLGLQSAHAADFIAQYQANGDLYGLILNIIDTMPIAPVILVLVLLTMIAFYATSFDSIAYTAASYSYKRLGEEEKPAKPITFLWCILLIVLPIALVFSESSMNNIQSVSIISAFPIGLIMILMIWAFLKDAKKYMKELKGKKLKECAESTESVEAEA
ncbi:MAG: BCCT family transporter [Parasporobacterium sp.]|nr:BCCT family transporter [Parasporobacterium sp.]